jgi:hypothetical protein
MKGLKVINLALFKRKINGLGYLLLAKQETITTIAK